MTDSGMWTGEPTYRRYEGPPLDLEPAEIRRLGGVIQRHSVADGVATAEDSAFVVALGEKLTDDHVLASFAVVGASEAELRRLVKDDGIATFLRSRIDAGPASDALGCAIGVGEVVIGVAAIAIAAAEEVGSAGIFTPGAVLTAAVGAAFIATGLAVATAQC